MSDDDRNITAIVEYAILRRGELWRGPMSKSDALRWLREWEADGGKPGMFDLGQRTVSAWSISGSDHEGDIENPDDRPAGVCRSFERCAEPQAEDSPLCPTHRDRAREESA